ncbi:MAG: glycosyltransferase family 39 protein [Candidatus Woesebacteria bacterium]|jgi:hypothetical protein
MNKSQKILKKLKKNKNTILVAILLFLAIFVRFWKMEFIPYESDGDELAYVFAGLSMIDHGIPTSWSSFGYHYPEENNYGEFEMGDELHRNQETYSFVRPWFDHPFLLPVIVGWTSKLFAYNFPSAPPAIIIRLPILFLSALSLTFLYLISKKLFGFKSALFTLIIVAFSPAIILGQRMVVGENLYLPFILIAIYLLLISKKIRLLPLILLTLVAVLSKTTGALILIIISLHFLIHKDYKKMFKYIIASLISIASVFILYAAVHDWSLFLTVIQKQSFRLLGWANPSFVLSNPGFLNFVLLDASYYLILILGAVAIFLMGDSKQDKFLKLSVLASLIMIWATSAEQDMLGWYKLPFFLLLAILMGKTFKVANRTVLNSLLFITVINNLGLVRFPDHPFPSTQTLRLVVSSIFLIILIFSLVKNSARKIFLQNFLTMALLAIYVVSSFYFVNKYFEASCKDRFCKLPMMTSKQLIKGLLKIKEK